MRQQMDNGRPGRPDLADFRGKEPPPTKVGEAQDGVVEPPVNEGDDLPVVAGTEGRDDAPPRQEDSPREAPNARKMSPQDERRARIAERFSRNRDVILGGEKPAADDAEGKQIYERLAGPQDEPADGGDPPAAEAAETNDTPEAPADAGPSASKEAAGEPDTITLAVNGRTVTKTRAEVLALSGLTDEEFAAKPDLAKRFAQRELATQANLERSKSRDLPARDEPAPRAGASDDAEKGDGAGDRRSTDGDTSHADIESLVNDIQISEPKDVAPKLQNLIEAVAKNAAKGIIQENEGNRRQSQELASNATALKDFLDDHKEIGELGDPSAIRAVGAAVSTGLEEVYREDLRRILIEEGESEQSADQILGDVTVSQLRSAHLSRRASGHPLARKIDKPLIEDVYGKVRSAFGVTGSTEQRQATPSRAERKANLTPQPRGAAAAAPATARPLAPGSVQSRKDAIAEMGSRTGRKPARLGPS